MLINMKISIKIDEENKLKYCYTPFRCIIPNIKRRWKLLGLPICPISVRSPTIIR